MSGMPWLDRLVLDVSRGSELVALQSDAHASSSAFAELQWTSILIDTGVRGLEIRECTRTSIHESRQLHMTMHFESI
jgi:hypothetical protein